MTRPLAIGFDLDDTLYDRDEVYERVYETMREDLPLSVPFEDFNAKYQELSIEEYQAFIKGEKSKEAYRQDRVIRAYAHFKMTANLKQADRFNELYQEYKADIRLRPAAKELFERLSQQDNITTFVLTNGPSPDQEKKCRALGVDRYLSDGKIYVSDAIGYSKPDPAVFDYVAGDLDMVGQPIYYIGDHYGNDVLAAAEADWRPIYFNYQEEAHATDFPMVKDFVELTQWLQAEGLMN